MAVASISARLLYLTTDDLMDTQQAAAFMGLKPATIRSWVHKGWLSPVLPADGRKARQHLFDAEDLKRAKKQVEEAQAARSRLAA